jgi:hypothetical protein
MGHGELSSRQLDPCCHRHKGYHRRASSASRNPYVASPLLSLLLPAFILSPSVTDPLLIAVAIVTTEHNSLSEYFVHPNDALSPHLRTTVRVRHGGNDRTMSQLPVATGCALFLRFLAGAVEEFEKSGGESFKNFNALQLLLWARRIDATVIPRFTNVEIEALLSRFVVFSFSFSFFPNYSSRASLYHLFILTLPTSHRLDRTHLRRFRTWASHLFNQSLANDEVAKKWANYWTSNFRPLPPAEMRRLEEVFVIVMEEVDYILAVCLLSVLSSSRKTKLMKVLLRQLHNPDPAPSTAAASSSSAREEVPPPYPRTPHSATLPSRPVVQAPSSSSRRPSVTATHRRSSVVHGGDDDEPRPTYDTAQSYSSSRRRRREEGRH